MIELIVDSRENSIKKMLSVPFKIEQLEVGDFLIKKDGKIICAVERKSIFDYASSISDGRNKNQATRLHLLKDDGVQVIYLIETYTLDDTVFVNYGSGSLPDDGYTFRGAITGKAVHTSICNKIIRDGFYVFQTTSLRDSVRFIEKILDKFSEVPEINTQNTQNTQSDYLKTISLSKKDNMTPENYYICALAQIPGMSTDSAQVVASVYPTFSLLIKAFTDSTNPSYLIADLKRPDSNRRLGDVLSDIVYKYLLPIKEKKEIIKEPKTKIKLILNSY